MSTYVSGVDLQQHRIWDGVVVRALHGERITVGILEFAPLTRVPEHRHDNEQLGLVVQGSITMVINGQRRALGVGDMYAVRSGMPHSGDAGPEGGTVVDVFSPVRADWNEAPRVANAHVRWP